MGENCYFCGEQRFFGQIACARCHSRFEGAKVFVEFPRIVGGITLTVRQFEDFSEGQLPTIKFRVTAVNDEVNLKYFLPQEYIPGGNTTVGTININVLNGDLRIGSQPIPKPIAITVYLPVGIASVTIQGNGNTGVYNKTGMEIKLNNATLKE